MSAPSGAALDVRGLTKLFGEQRALDGVNLLVRPGSVHGLLGENGSGKSTLIKILSGLYQPDAGSVAIAGEAASLPLTPAAAERAGLQFVHQDLGLIPSLSVAENLLLGELSAGRTGALVSDRAMRRAARQMLEGYDLDIPVAVAVSELRPVDRALVAIVRAVAAIEREGRDGAPGILVLDEPTVFLPRGDVERVFALVRRLAASGCAVILVSHDLDEVLEVTDDVTVLRDGRVVGTAETAGLARDELVHMIVGRAVDLVTRPVPPADRSAAPVALEARGLSGPLVHDVALRLHQGEILGLTGLAGSGFDQLPYLLYGAQAATTGTVAVAHHGRLEELDATRLTVARAQRLRLGLVPSDRRHLAGIGSLDLIDNITMLRLARMRGPLGLDHRRMREDTAGLLERFDVRPREPRHAFGTLSGGNQQKALLAKWLAAEPAVLLIDEPTQGVDIGAREQIFGILREAASRGVSIVCASTDHEQLAALTDRTLIVARGRITAELTGAQLTKSRISQACLVAPQPETIATGRRIA